MGWRWRFTERARVHRLRDRRLKEMMMKVAAPSYATFARLASCVVVLLVASSHASAQASAAEPSRAAGSTLETTKPFLRGTLELRPVLGASSSVLGGAPQSANQLYTGVDVLYWRGGAQAIAAGAWVATDEGFVGAGAHVDWRYRFHEVHPIVLPGILAGGSVHFGSPRTGNHRDTLGALGLRVGASLDFRATPRVFPGIQATLDAGPRFLGGVAAFVGAQFLFGVSFTL
jgi:hypothetical protein